jgi:DNA-binding NarL/FixJ family response regulator
MRIGGRADIVIRMNRPSSSPIRILTADDHPLIRAGLVTFLATEPELQIVAEAENGEEALEKYRGLCPDIVLMDLSMPVMDGVAATRAILDEFPDARVIVLTTYQGDEDIHRALDAGAMGYLVKDMMVADILNVIRTVHGGRRGIPPPVAAKLAEHTPRIPLSPRETEVLLLVAKGLTNAEIAGRIGRTEETVKVHVKNILQKLDARDRTEAVTSALRRGFIRLE